MITKNGSELLKGNLSATLYNSYYYGGVDGEFRQHNGVSYSRVYSPYAPTTAETYGRRNAYMMVLFSACGYGEYAIAKKSDLGTYNPGNSIFVCTYDDAHADISPDMYQAPGNDITLTASVTTQNNIFHTITFTNSTSESARVNRISIYYPVGTAAGEMDASKTADMLVHLFAIDDIVLAPGETKSITITLEL